jgi:large subunit ribosomal protein L17
MRHRVKTKKLNRNKSQREALLRNLVKSLILKKSIITTSAKAKETRRFAEKLVTIAKKDTVNGHKRVFHALGDKKVVKRFFAEIVPHLGERTSGNIRLIKTGMRKGDGADMSLIEFIFGEGKETKKKREKAKPKARLPRLRRRKKTVEKKEEKPKKKKEKKETKPKEEKKKSKKKVKKVKETKKPAKKVKKEKKK